VTFNINIPTQQVKINRNHRWSWSYTIHNGLIGRTRIKLALPPILFLTL